MITPMPADQARLKAREVVLDFMAYASVRHEVELETERKKKGRPKRRKKMPEADPQLVRNLCDEPEILPGESGFVDIKTKVDLLRVIESEGPLTITMISPRCGASYSAVHKWAHELRESGQVNSWRKFSNPKYPWVYAAKWVNIADADLSHVGVPKKSL